MGKLEYIIRPEQEPKNCLEFEKKLDELVADLKDLGSDYMQSMYVDILEEIHKLIMNFLDVIIDTGIKRLGK